MEFTQSGPDIIRSEHQRRLVEYWAAGRGRAQLTIWHGLHASDFPVPVDNLALTQVVEQDGGARFQLEFHGQHLAKSFGGMNCVGMFLDEILPEPYLHAALATYRQAALNHVAVYTVSD